jgi:hypothetical protein
LLDLRLLLGGLAFGIDRSDAIDVLAFGFV